MLTFTQGLCVVTAVPAIPSLSIRHDPQISEIRPSPITSCQWCSFGTVGSSFRHCRRTSILTRAPPSALAPPAFVPPSSALRSMHAFLCAALGLVGSVSGERNFTAPGLTAPQCWKPYGALCSGDDDCQDGPPYSDQCKCHPRYDNGVDKPHYGKCGTPPTPAPIPGKPGCNAVVPSCRFADQCKDLHDKVTCNDWSAIPCCGWTPFPTPVPTPAPALYKCVSNVCQETNSSGVPKGTCESACGPGVLN